MAPSDPVLDLHVRRLKALGHAARLAIVRVVVQGPEGGTPAGEIQARLGIPGSTLSHHLSELTQAGLLQPSRQGTTIRYAACFDHLRALTDYVWENCCGSGRCGPDCP
ncbi:ArsR/SmtB family transcription factor [Mesoterricola sediminis]|uniref:Transcriptional regulator n=1 Tax=Mesoterricola sediminis TaxID=2927980 RepID=A0AA48GRV6_9BACT|nr:metalloregulator ArsR/SmtB family transcription factor [Mesoterricola sediminis]BDU76437.1 transcriptional regulator [Mesoterricola sediminis]